MRPDFRGVTSGRTGVSSMADDGVELRNMGQTWEWCLMGGVKTFLTESGGALMK